ncbi:DUF881 domain-containing protein [Tessaracoccus sp. Z1128]
MRRPDASMSLLTDLAEGALEPEYREHASRPRSPARLLIAVALVALLLTLAALQTTRGAGSAATQRAELLDRVAAARARQATLTALSAELEAEVRELGDSALGDPLERQRLAEAELAAGNVPVAGPGIVITVDDAEDATQAKGLVLDSDLSRLVNGLWAAGAEAVAVNGRRLSALTPIRAAGAAITVDFVSLSPPYRVEAIGDQRTMQARFNESASAAWWQFLTMNYGLSMHIEQPDDDLILPADPGMALRYATTD